MGILDKIINKHTLSLASNAVMPVVGMVTISMLARNLTEADFGNWTFFLITYSLANFFRTGFLQTSLVKFYSGADKKRALNVAGSTWILGFVITSILGILCFLTYLFYHGDVAVEIIIKWFSIIFFCTLPSSVALWILQAEGRFDRMFILQLVGQGCFFTSVIVLIVIHQTHFKMVVYAYCISAIITSLFTLINGWAKIITMAHKSWACIKELANFGKFSVGTSISSYLLRGSDTYIIKYMFADPASVGIYYLPQRLMEIVEIPLRSFIATALPPIAAAMHRNDKREMTYIMKKYAGILTILLIPVSIIAFISADLIINIIGGAGFSSTPAANIFRIFMSFAILLPIDRFFGITLDILNQPQKNMIKVILMLTVNVAGDFLGIYIFHNIYGVAISSFFTFLMGIVYGYWQLKMHLDFTIKDILEIGFVESKAIIVNAVKNLRIQSKNE